MKASKNAAESLRRSSPGVFIAAPSYQPAAVEVRLVATADAAEPFEDDFVVAIDAAEPFEDDVAATIDAARPFSRRPRTGT